MQLKDTHSSFYKLSAYGTSDKASVAETIDASSISGKDKPEKSYEDWYLKLPCLTFNNKRFSVKLLSTMFDRQMSSWQLDS